MSRKLVGENRNWRPSALLKTTPPAAFLPQRTLADVWAGVNPYNRPQDQLGPQAGIKNPNAAGLAKYNTDVAKTIAAANAETGQNYLTRMSGPAPGAPNQLGNALISNIHTRVPIGDKSMVSIPLGRAMGGFEGIATPESLAEKFKDAQIIEGGFGPLEGVLGVLLTGLGFPGGPLSNLIGRLPAGLQKAIKIGGGIKTAADVVTTKGKSAPGALLSGGLRANYKP